MTDSELRIMARDLKEYFNLAAVNPSTDTLVSATEKFRKHGMGCLLVSVGNGGVLCLCANPEMGKKLIAAIDRIGDELVAENMAAATGESNDKKGNDGRHHGGSGRR